LAASGVVERRGRIRGPCLVEISAGAARTFALDAREITIGSEDDNRIVLDTPTVSRHHAIIRRIGKRFEISDLESTNGTYVNGTRIARPTALRPGDEVRIAATRLRFEKPPQAGISGKLTAFALGLVVAAGGVGLYEFRSNWNEIEFAADFIASPTPSPTVSPVPAAIVRTPTATVRATPTPTLLPHGAHRLATPRATRRPRPTRTAPMTATESPTETPVPSASPTRTITPGSPPPVPIPPPSASSDWLGALNAYRKMAHLEPVTIDPKLSAGDVAHAKYLVTNYGAEIAKGEHLGAAMHREDASRPGFSETGLAAAQHSDVNEWIAAAGITKTVSWAIDSWMTAPFHRANILNPALHRVGYGEYCDDGVCVAVMDTVEGADMPSAYGTTYEQPVEFPASASVIALRGLLGEWPDPLSVCSGYSLPAGLPITVQIGANVEAKLTTYSLVATSGDAAGTVEPACGFDATTYTNPERLAQDLARTVLHGYGEVVVIPKNPLLRGTQYRIEMTVNGKRYAWSFTTAP
jgi:uncharacterized protein YkwD